MFENRPRLLASTFYLFYFGAIGAILPYLNLYYQSRGMDTKQIGYLAALRTFMAIVAAPFWGMIADVLRIHKYMLVVAVCGTLIPSFLLGHVAGFWTLSTLIILYFFFLSPIMPLADNAILQMIKERESYGQLRVWGGIGWGIAAWASGVMAENDGLTAIFTIYLALMVLNLIVVWPLPVPQIGAPDSSYFVELKLLFRNRAWIGFLASMLLIGISYAILNEYFAIYLKALGAGESLFGLSIAAASVSEVPVYLLSAYLMRKLTPRGLLMVAFFSLMVRAFFYSFIVDPRWAIAGQLLHGPSFSAMWAAAVVYVSKIAPDHLGATAQSVLGTTLFGIAGVIGAIFGAQVYDFAGPVTLFRIAGVVAIGGMIFFWTMGGMEEETATARNLA